MRHRIIKCYLLFIDNVSIEKAHLVRLKPKTVNQYFQTFRMMLHAFQFAEWDESVEVSRWTRVFLHAVFGEHSVPESVKWDAQKACARVLFA